MIKELERQINWLGNHITYLIFLSKTYELKVTKFGLVPKKDGVDEFWTQIRELSEINQSLCNHYDQQIILLEAASLIDGIAKKLTSENS